MAQRYAIIDRTTNVVQNVIMLDSAEEWTVNDPFALQSDVAGPGDTYNGDGTFTRPPQQDGE